MVSIIIGFRERTEVRRDGAKITRINYTFGLTVNTYVIARQHILLLREIVGCMASGYRVVVVAPITEGSCRTREQLYMTVVAVGCLWADQETPEECSRN